MAAYRRTHSPSQLVWFEGWLVFSLHSLNEPSELLQWPCHDDSNININNIIHDYNYYYKYDWLCLLSLYLITQEHGSVEPLLVCTVMRISSHDVAASV